MGPADDSTSGPQTSPPPARAEKLNTKAAGIVGLAVLCSRILGLGRELIFAALFGGGRLMDAFTIAFRIPNLLRDLFAEGALSTSFITTFSKTIATDGDHAAWKLANKVGTLTVIVLSSITIVGIITAPWLVHVLAPGFDGDPTPPGGGWRDGVGRRTGAASAGAAAAGAALHTCPSYARVPRCYIIGAIILPGSPDPRPYLTAARGPP